MKLPNAGSAVVDINKLRDYVLSPDHPRGRHKARVFAATFGLQASDAEWLRLQLLAAALRENAVQTNEDSFGRRYVLDFEMSLGDRTATVRSAWIIRTGEEHARLTSCYVL
jgi:hypothetical protein